MDILLVVYAILLFGKDSTILSALPQHRTDAIYRVKNLDRYDDRDDIRTNLIESYDRLMEFVDKHLNDMFYLEGSQRRDVRNKIAREICSNVLMHREFTSAFPAKLIIEKDIFTTTIPLKKTINVSEKNTIEISKGQNELLNDPLNELLDDTQNKILNLIKDKNSLTYDEISNQLNISSSTVKRKINEMKKLDIIVRVNGKRDGYWKILK